MSKTIIPTTDMTIDGRPAKAGEPIPVSDTTAEALIKQKLAKETEATAKKK